MKSQHISILSGDSDGNSAASTTADSSTGSTAGFANYRARYQAFVNQQSQKNLRRSNGTSSLVRFTQGVISFAIFIVLFLAILTLFGFGLSRFGGSAQVSQSDAAATKKNTAEASPSPGMPKKNNRNR